MKKAIAALMAALAIESAEAAPFDGVRTPESGTTVYTINGQTVVVTREPLPAVPYRETYPGIEKKWTWLDTLLFGDPQIKINCQQAINRFDPRCRDHKSN